MLGFRRVVYLWQWVALVLIPIIGGLQSAGWGTVFALAAAIVEVPAMVTTALMSTLPRDLRASKAVPPLYAILSVILWAVTLSYPLSVENSGDSNSVPSAFEALGLPWQVDQKVSQVLIFLAIGLWIASFVAVLARVRTMTPSVPVRSLRPEVAATTGANASEVHE